MFKKIIMCLSLLIAGLVFTATSFAGQVNLKTVLVGKIQTIEGEQEAFVKILDDGNIELLAGIVHVIDEAKVIEDRTGSDEALILEVGPAKIIYYNSFGEITWLLQLNGESAKLTPVVYFE